MRQPLRKYTKRKAMKNNYQYTTWEAFCNEEARKRPLAMVHMWRVENHIWDSLLPPILDWLPHILWLSHLVTPPPQKFLMRMHLNWTLREGSNAGYGTEYHHLMSLGLERWYSGFLGMQTKYPLNKNET